MTDLLKNASKSQATYFRQSKKIIATFDKNKLLENQKEIENFVKTQNDKVIAPHILYDYHMYTLSLCQFKNKKHNEWERKRDPFTNKIIGYKK